MAGQLIVCATPIGNMDDISVRALNALKSADLIAAEDTRHTLGLLNHFDIRTPLVSCHQYNENDRAPEIIEKLQSGLTVVLVSDAGTPAVSDPGEVLVRHVREAGIPVTAIPGPCAAITALSMSGMPSRRFVFEGFLPVPTKERRAAAERLKSEERTAILYEAPHRLKETLRYLYDQLGDRELLLARELTKIHEEAIGRKLSEWIAYYEEHDPRGEYVLILGGADPEALHAEKQAEFMHLTLTEHMALKAGMPPKEAMKAVAAERGMTRREVYAGLLKEKEERGEED